MNNSCTDLLQAAVAKRDEDKQNLGWCKMKIKDKLAWSMQENKDTIERMIKSALAEMDFEDKALLSEYISVNRRTEIWNYRLVEAIVNEFDQKTAENLYSKAYMLATDPERDELDGFYKRTIFPDVRWNGTSWKFVSEEEADEDEENHSAELNNHDLADVQLKNYWIPVSLKPTSMHLLSKEFENYESDRLLLLNNEDGKTVFGQYICNFEKDWESWQEENGKDFYPTHWAYAPKFWL